MRQVHEEGPPIDCPNCGKLCPPGSHGCDCGWRFLATDANRDVRRPKDVGLNVIGVVAIVVGLMGVIGWAKDSPRSLRSSPLHGSAVLLVVGVALTRARKGTGQINGSLQDPAFVDDVRRRLEHDQAPEGFRRLRRRRLRDLTGLGAMYMVLGATSRHDSAVPLLAGAAVWVALLVCEYRRRPEAVVLLEDDVTGAATGSRRCVACRGIVLPRDSGECMACGVTMKPLYAKLIAGGLLVLLALAAWIVLR